VSAPKAGERLKAIGTQLAHFARLRTCENHLQFTNEGTLPAGATRIIGQTPPYDHCNMTVTTAGPTDALARFGDLLRAMDYGDAAVRPLLDLEGLRQWVPGRTIGYAQLERAVDETAFYDDAGHVTAAEYRP